MQKSLDGKIKVRTNILVFDGERTIVKCRRCKADVPLDVQLGAELRKALAEDGGPRLVVRNGINCAEKKLCVMLLTLAERARSFTPDPTEA